MKKRDRKPRLDTRDPWALAALSLTVIEFLEGIVANAFESPSDWVAWRVCLKDLFGLPMTPEEVGIFREYTHRSTPPITKAREGHWVIGRRGGKGRVAALIACYMATCRDHRLLGLGPGEHAVVVVMAQNKGKAQDLYKGIVGLLKSVPVLAALIDHEDAETIWLKNGARIEVQASSFRSVRGGDTVIACLADEVAFWWSAPDSANPDVEVIGAITPAMFTVGDALLLCLSSPYRRAGVLWNAYRDHFGRDLDPVRVWQASTRAMHPKIDQTILDAEIARDPVGARAEIDAQFRLDLESFVSPEIMARAVWVGWQGEAPQPGVRYWGFADLAGGSGGDSSTLAIARRLNGQYVIVCILEFRPLPEFSAVDAANTMAATLKSYGLDKVMGDAIGGGVHRDIFRKAGIKYVFVPTKPVHWTKSQIFHDVLPLLTSGLVVLPDHKRTTAQFLALERTTIRGSSKETIGHPRGGWDDLANACAGALLLAARGAAMLEGYSADSWRQQETGQAPGATKIVVEQGMRVEYRLQPWGQWTRNRIVGRA